MSDPSTIFGADLAGWWRAADFTDADGTPEGTWVPAGGSLGGNLTQATSSKQPTLQTVTANGKTYKAVGLDSVDDYMQSAWLPDGDLTYFFVARATTELATASQVYPLVSASIGGSSNTAGTLNLQLANSFNFGLGNHYSTDQTTAATLYVDGAEISNGAVDIGTTWHVLTGSAVATTQKEAFTLGTFPTSNFYAPVQIAEIVAVSAIATANQRAALDTYFQDTYGITVSDYVSSGPPSGTASGTVSWTGSASGTTTRSGAASGTVAWAGSASGTATHEGTASGAVAWAGSASGTTTRSGTAAGTLTWTGAASGTAPALGAKSGTAAGTVTWTGAASGQATHSGTADGTLTWVGAATGTTQRSGTASGSLAWVGAASGKNTTARNITVIAFRGPHGHTASSKGPHGHAASGKGPHGHRASSRGPHT